VSDSEFAVISKPNQSEADTSSAVEVASASHGGVNFCLDDGVPAKGELIGDQLPGYADMDFGSQIWSWLTRKQRAVIDGQILKEIKHHDKDQKNLAENLNKT
jgi:hypothetical protein